MQLPLKFAIILFFYSFLFVRPLAAGITISPYVRIKSTKSIKPAKDSDTETEKIKQKQEYGIRGAISFWSLFKTSLSVGQSKLTVTEKAQYAKDEYDEIDYKEDLDMSTDDPDKDIKTTDTQNLARFSLILDPSFSIIIMRAKIGVTARQRTLKLEEAGKDPISKTTTTYKPHSGVGCGVRISYNMYFMIEYSAYHYKFPDIEPFEREVSVSYGISI